MMTYCIMSDIKVVNSGPDTIKVSINETPKINVSSPDVSVVKVLAQRQVGQFCGLLLVLGLSDDSCYLYGSVSF